MKLLDTNVVMYATGGSHPYRDACRAILALVEREPEAYGIDIELTQELLDVYARREGIAKGIKAVEVTLTLFPNPFPIARREVEHAMRFLTPRTKLSPRDAIHAAVCITYGLEGIVSADRAFDRVPGVRRFDPLKLAGS